MNRCAALVLCCLALNTFSTRGESKFLEAPFWDDGQAEIAVYKAERPHYGQLYPSEITYYLVKEPFNPKEKVKSNTPEGDGVVPAIKLNQVITTPTGTYTYQQMHSAFWSKKAGTLLKASLSHHEACGSSYKEVLRSGDQFHYLAHTYWQGQSRVERSIALSSTTWWQDELPFQLRRLVADDQPLPEPIFLIPTMIHSKAGATGPKPATLQRDGFTVTVTHVGGKDQLTFDPEWPHIMTSWKQADGTRLTLKKHLRLDYWNHHDPDDSLDN
jgi:hypothetical protein